MDEEVGLADEMREIAEVWTDANTIDAGNVAAMLRKWARELDEEYVELPKDAEGRPWHVGDRCIAEGCYLSGKEHGRIIELQLCENGEFVARVLPDKKAEGMRFRMSELSRPCAPADRLREWVRGARNDEHMDLRELDAIADAMDGGATR